MPHYRFRIQQRDPSGTSELGTDFSDDNAALEELAKVSGDLIGSIARHLAQNESWQIELLDEASKPKFRISLAADTLDK